MSRIKETLQNKKALITFVTGGDPDLATTEKLIYGMEEAGANLIEIGIPFSDPVAEGPVIQAANERALKAGTTIEQLFSLVEKVRKTVKVPLVFLTYMNPIFTYGCEKFAARCAECQIDGVIVPDLPYEEKGELDGVMQQYQVDLISLIAPTSKERIAKIAKNATGFLYCVSSLGVTGTRTNITNDIKHMVIEAKKYTNIPCAIGFGISTKDQAKRMSDIADGVIIGSAIVKLVEQFGVESIEHVKTYIRNIKEEMNR